MCGIVGIVGPQDDAWLSAMNAVQRHRGPDDCGEYRDRDAGVSLAMHRLSILDLAGGHQPMFSRSGRTCIVYNGEIFNSPDLRRRLEARGVQFGSSNSDTEVLLELWEQHGEQMVDHLNGMFAFVLHDRERQLLFGARDPVGIKPLYYTSGPSRFAFASELKALLALPDVRREIDRDSLFHYASLRFVPGDRSIVDSVKRLPPGHRFTLRLPQRELRVERYWRLQFRPEQASVEEWAERIREGLRGAVGRWVLSDVPVACSLSGGLDSSAIVALLGESGRRVRTYSLGFAGADERDVNELPVAREVAQRWGTDHHEVVLEPDVLLRDLLRMTWHLDEPYGGGLPSWYVFEFMAKDVKVGLTGSGGDELFGDYGRYRSYERSRMGDGLAGFAEQLRPLAPRMAAGVTRLEQHLGPARTAAHAFSQSRFTREYFDRYYYFSDEAKRSAVFTHADGRPDTAALLGREAVGENPRDAITAASFGTQLPEEFLMMTDRFSMAHSLEARVPFLDREFVDLMSRVPADVRTRRSDLKYLLKRAIHGMVPDSVIDGQKRGFVLPTALWLRGTLRPLVERLFEPRRLAAQGLFRPDLYATLVRPHLDGHIDRSGQIWTLLMFQLWHVVFVEHPSLEPPTASWRDLC
jgi:asparagine synthase (glutamine-hydrolysing)